MNKIRLSIFLLIASITISNACNPILTANSYSYTFCEYDSNNVGQFNWDEITLSLNLLVAPQQLNDFTVTYHSTYTNALSGNGALTNGYQNNTNPKTVYIRVENITTGCGNASSIASLQLRVSQRPSIYTVPVYERCASDASSQGVSIFDLSSLDTTIANTFPLINEEVLYYETYTDLESNINVISNPSTYTNIANPQTLYAHVRNTITGCTSDPITVNLQVNSLPSVDLPQNYILCIDTNTGQASNPIELGIDFGPGYSYSWNIPSGLASTPTVIANQEGTYQLTVTDENHSTYCSYSTATLITQQQSPCPLSIEEFEDFSITIYPNPTTENITIENIHNSNTVIIYDINGKMLIQKSIQESRNKIELSLKNYPKGIYFVKILSKETKFTHKVIKQ